MNALKSARHPVRAALVVALTAFALLAAACGGGSDQSVGSGSGEGGSETGGGEGGESGEATPPPVTDGLVTWFTSDAGVSEDGGEVTGWADQIGGNDVAPEGTPPTVIESALNGHDVVAFDPEMQTLVKDDPTGLPTGNSDRSVVIVGDFKGYYEGVGWGAPVTDGASFYVGQMNGNCFWHGVGVGMKIGSYGSSCGGVGGSAETVDGETTLNDAGYVVVTATVENGTLNVYVDDRSILTVSNVFETADSQLWVGTWPGFERTGDIDFDVANVMIYERALSEDEVGQIMDYASEQYGI